MNWLPLTTFSEAEPQFDFEAVFGPKQARQVRSDAGSSMLPAPPLNDPPTLQPPFNYSRPTASPRISLGVSNVELQSVESPQTQILASSPSSARYADGGGGRDTRTTELPNASTTHFEDASSPSFAQSRVTEKPRFAFKATEQPRSILTVVEDATSLSESTYLSIVSHFRRLCVGACLPFVPFASDHIPSLETFNVCSSLYFKHFHLPFPFLHKPTFCRSNDWLVALAVVSTGATYLEEAYEIADVFQEFLRRAIIHEKEVRDDINAVVGFVQAGVLSIIGFSQSYDLVYARKAVELHAALVFRCRQYGFLRETEDAPASSICPDRVTDYHFISSQWSRWILAEQKRRLGYAIYLIDCIMAYQQGSKALLALLEITAMLPCQDHIWESHSEIAWAQTNQKSLPSPYLRSALEALYQGKKPAKEMAEFGHIILVHALYRKTWDIGSHTQQPESDSNPLDLDGTIRNSFEVGESQWLPSIPAYNWWRNSACDCLDTLHWHANSLIGEACGLEHHTVLHLHMARVVLLTPFEEIINFVNSLIKHGSNELLLSATSDMRAAELAVACHSSTRTIWRWLSQDHHKARLAVVHAGVLLWHVRRYSRRTFHEPFAVFLAIITLWAYGSYNRIVAESCGEVESSTELYNEPRTDPDIVSGMAEQDYIQIDRPADDEIVQLFVRKGRYMRAMVNGVGELCEPNSPARILIQGRKLLKLRLWSWQSSRRYHDTLMSLASVF
jgi:Fungal specific transcription factor domain